MKENGSTPEKKPYRTPGLRVYGPMEQLTHSMWWGLFPDHLGNVQNEPPVNYAPGDMNKGMKGMKKVMS